MLSIGLMSGTSMDGIDAALLETDGEKQIKKLGHCSLIYNNEFKLLLKAAEYVVRKYCGDLNAAHIYFQAGINDYLKNELKLSEPDVEKKVNELSFYIHLNRKKPITLDEVSAHSTQLHGAIVKELLNKYGYNTMQINVVGYHGQTLFHRPSAGITIQIGDGQFLAEQLGITVINNFRQRDVAAGGQGAPFAPLYHHALAMRDKKIPLAVVNCGGISNITLIKNDNVLDLIGFDTGPGNNLIDRFVRQRTRGKTAMDKDGQFGKKGKIDTNVLKALYDQSIIKDGKNYFSERPPKSLDSGDMQLIPELDLLSLEDGCATLEVFTADTIITSLNMANLNLPMHWILCGGGWKNPVIRREFEHRLKQKLNEKICIQTADEAGWQSQSMEAEIFAYLAVRSLKNKPISLPGTTRVPRPLSGGHICLPRTPLRCF